MQCVECDLRHSARSSLYVILHGALYVILRGPSTSFCAERSAVAESKPLTQALTGFVDSATTRGMTMQCVECDLRHFARRPPLRHSARSPLRHSARSEAQSQNPHPAASCINNTNHLSCFLAKIPPNPFSWTGKLYNGPSHVILRTDETSQTDFNRNALYLFCNNFFILRGELNECSVLWLI